MKALVLMLGAVALLLSAGCAGPTGTSETSGTSGTSGITSYNESAVLKVSVLQSGSVLVDGEAATIQALDNALAELDEANGVVWYYRENGQAEPPAIAVQVLDAIVAHRRPISLSSKPDFSDVVNPSTGESKPRF